jgi:hypothetical protein
MRSRLKKYWPINGIGHCGLVSPTHIEAQSAIYAPQQIVALILLAISVAALLCADLRCHPGDTTTTNHRPICGAQR